MMDGPMKKYIRDGDSIWSLLKSEEELQECLDKLKVLLEPDNGATFRQVA